MTKSKKLLKTLHIASFNGNIGDLANHEGANNLFNQYLDFQLEYTNLEIREFYWKRKAFDREFIVYANKFDLVIFGGGNYFELWLEDSATGTSIDINLKDLNSLKVPTLFYSLGVDLGQGYSKKSKERFQKFIGVILEKNNFFFCVRNDGSRKALNEILGEELSSKIPIIPDGGFFTLAEKKKRVLETKNCIGINIAGDMLEKRFNQTVNKEFFINEISKTCCELIDLDPSLKIYLIPHIWKDILLIVDLLKAIDDHYLRKNIFIENLEPNIYGLNQFISNYQKYKLVLGMRFHANVCPIGMNIPTRGLFNYPQIKLLYEELNIEDRLINVKEIGIKENILDCVLNDFKNINALKRKYNNILLDLNSQAKSSLELINLWLIDNFY